MKEIEYKLLGVDDLELLVKIRIKDLKMFSNQKIISDLFFNNTIPEIRTSNPMIIAHTPAMIPKMPECFILK